MHEVYFTLFISLSTMVYDGSAMYPESSTNQSTSTLLPLIVIAQGGETVLGSRYMDQCNADDDGYLMKGTTFKSGSSVDNNQLFFCGPDDTNGGNEIIPFLVGTDKYCSFLTDMEDSKYLRCTNEPQPYIRQVEMFKSSFSSTSHSACGPSDKDGMMYSFQYKACIPRSDRGQSRGPKIANRHDIEIYRFCYSHQDNQVLYTEYDLKSTRLLTDTRMARDQEQTFSMITERYQSLDVDFETIKESFDNLEIQNENEKVLSQTFNTPRIGKSPLHAEKLVPHEDLAFGLWRKTTYHVVNYRAMRENTIQLWEYINQLIREDALNNNREFTIYSGAFNIPEGDKTGYMVPVADIWIKIIKCWLPIPAIRRTESFAVILNNNLDRSYMNSLFDRICPVNLCENGFIDRFPEIGDTVRCCAVTPGISSFFNIKIYNPGFPFMIESFKRKTNNPFE